MKNNEEVWVKIAESMISPPQQRVGTLFLNCCKVIVIAAAIVFVVLWAGGFGVLAAAGGHNGDYFLDHRYYLQET